MADNVTLPGTDAVVSTEEITTLNTAGVTAQHAQRAILALRTADATAVDLPGDAANGLDVDVTRMAALVASEAHIGQLGGHTALIAVTLSVDTNAYADGDVLATTQAVTAIARANDVPFVLMSVVAIDKADQGMGMDLLFLSTNYDLGTENSAPNIEDAEGDAILGMVQISSSDWYDLGAFRMAQKLNLNMPMIPVAGTDDIYIAAISRGTGTYGASDITLRLGVQRD